ncbi:MAG: VCBS repeat-containing protein [Theionarchaea archaeon]|nr:VCBS repeat-containing protein [Theionarchaea archaeon]
MIRKVLLSLCIGALLLAPIVAQEGFVKEWEKNYSTEKQKEIIQCMGVGDLNNDGAPEIVLGLNVRPLAGVQSYAVQVLDYKGNRKLRWDSTYRINDISIVDVDGDGKAEILAPGADLYVLSDKAQNLNYPPVGTVVNVALAGDLDQDGKKELLVGTREVICISDTVPWTVSIGSPVKKILVADVNWDTFLEVVILTDQNVHVLDMNGKKVWTSPGTQNLRDVTVANIDRDNPLEILYSTDNMKILIWEARDEGLEKEINLVSYRADLFQVEDLNKDGTLEIIVASSKLRLEILDLEGKSLLQYRFELMGGQDAFVDMIVEDMDGDTWKDILLAHSVDFLTGSTDSYLYFMKNQWSPPPPSQSGELYTEALGFFNNNECSRAMELFTQAKTAFLDEGNQEMADDCQEYIDECNRLLTIQLDADSKFLEAEGLVQQGEYEKAVTLYEEAQALYEELGNLERVQTCSDRIEEIQNREIPVEEPPEEVPEKKQSGLFLIVVIIVVLIALGLYIVMSRRGRGENAEEETSERIKELEEIERPEIVPSEEIREGERKLKAQFVYGEINKEEYREKLRQLYESES